MIETELIWIIESQIWSLLGKTTRDNIDNIHVVPGSF